VPEFNDKTVLITGAAGALGRALTAAFAALGANIVVAARRDADQIAAQTAGEALGVTLDVTTEAHWAKAVSEAETRFGGVDVLINNAAYLQVGTTESIEISEWHNVIDTNLTGALLGIRAVAPSMRKRGAGSIVNINSIAGLAAAPGLVAYSSSKWALRGLMRAAAVELAPDNIRVNAVHAGIIDTPLAYDADGNELVPMKEFAIPRQAQPAEIAEFVTFIASDRASFATGSELVVDGGFLLGPVPMRRAQMSPTAS
jgi:3alpha(or 20beta)-hydroxysteroid dehydrogenase